MGDAQNSFSYAVIVTRNAFGLNPAPLPPGPPPTPGPELAKVIFSGTMNNKGKKEAMFAVKTTDAKKQETTTYLSLAEGETSGPVQLVSISPGGEEVEIMNSGTSMALNMKDNGFEKTSPALPGMRVLTVSPGSQLPGAQPQSAAPPTTYDTRAGINVRNTERAIASSGIRVNDVTPAASVGPINPAASFQPVVSTPNPSLASKNGGSGIMVVGPTAPPNNPVTSTPSAPLAGGMPLNSTPPPTPVGRSPIMPPTPPTPGQ